MERRLGLIGPSWRENFLGPFCVENAISLLGFFGVIVFYVRENIVAALCILP